MQNIDAGWLYPLILGLFRLRVHQFGAGRIIGAGLMDAGIALISRS
jgi:hypothetical protein